MGLVVPDPAEPLVTSDVLLGRADTSMYAGKRLGKGMLVLYRPDLTATMDHPDLPTLLADALGDEQGRDGFTVHYQPIVRMDDRTPVAVEALARWTHSLVGAVPPDVFVSIAERAGLIATLDNLVLERSCQDMAALRDRHGMDLDVHVNISATRLGDPELESAVLAALDRSGLPARQLVLEVTETARIPDLTIAGDAARRLPRPGHPARPGRLRLRLQHAAPAPPAAGGHREAGPRAARDRRRPAPGRGALPFGGVDLGGPGRHAHRRGTGDAGTGGDPGHPRLRAGPGPPVRSRRAAAGWRVRPAPVSTPAGRWRPANRPPPNQTARPTRRTAEAERQAGERHGYRGGISA